MKKIALILCIIVVAMSLNISILVSGEGDAEKITLSAENMVDENIYKYHDIKLINKMSVLCDNQDKFGDSINDPLPNANDISTTMWKPNFAEFVTGAYGYIDLQRNYKINKIVLFDTNASPTLTISTGKPFAWQKLTTIHLNQYNTFRVIDVDAVSTRYLHFDVPANDSGICEVVLYGSEDRSAEVEKPYAQPPKVNGKTTCDVALGVNAFVDDPLQVSKVGGHIREFHNISFTNNGKNYFNPSVNGGWNFDEYYKSLYSRGIDVIPCIQGTNTAISGENIVDYSGNEKPIPEGADPSDPMSYKAHASVMFNYAARYGSEKVDTSRLNLGDNQKPITGLGYIKYYENFNEQNKDWEGEKSYLSPYQFAAMCSADYDGHEGVLGKDYGIIQADKNAKLVMGGLVGRNVIEYIRGMKVWFEANRKDKNFVVDVINLHYYVKTSVAENTTMQEDLKKITDYVAKNLPGAEVWVTEFGPEIPESEIADRYSDEYYTAKAYATVRMFLLGMAANVDRMTMFMLRDTESGVYSTDGLVTAKGSWQTKPSWHYLYGARTALKGTVFDSVVRQDDGMYIYKFKGSGKDVYALWLPTSDTSKQASYALDVSGKKSVYSTKLVDFYENGITDKMQISGGSVSVAVSAVPVFISTYDVENVRIAKAKELIEVRSITGASNTIKKVQVMFDEQNIAPITPTAKLRGEFDNYEDNQDYIDTKPNNPENSFYPITAILDLGKNYYLTDIGFYDSNNVGDIIVYALDGFMQWRQVGAYNLGQYNVWKVIEVEQLISTRYVKIEKYSGAACYEMALFGYSEFD